MPALQGAVVPLCLPCPALTSTLCFCLPAPVPMPESVWEQGSLARQCRGPDPVSGTNTQRGPQPSGPRPCQRHGGGSGYLLSVLSKGPLEAGTELVGAMRTASPRRLLGSEQTGGLSVSTLSGTGTTLLAPWSPGSLSQSSGQ